jgi:DNA-directed RNA polymerase III subunit RPC4
MPNKRLCVLGEVSKRFVVSPNVDTLLAAMEAANSSNDIGQVKEESTLMDTS